MKSVALIVFTAALSISCAKDEGSHGGSNLAFDAQATQFQDQYDGEFVEVPESQLPELGLTPEDFEGRQPESPRLDPRIQTGMSSMYLNQMEFMNGTLVAARTSTVVSSVSPQNIISNLLAIAAASTGTKLQFSVDTTCYVAQEDNYSYLKCDSSNTKVTPISGSPFDFKDVSCWVFGHQNYTTTKKYGFFKLNDGREFKVLWQLSSYDGTVECGEQVDHGPGSSRTFSISTPDLPDLAYPSDGSRRLIYSYSTVSKQDGTIMTRMRSMMER